MWDKQIFFMKESLAQNKEYIDLYMHAIVPFIE